MTAPVVVLGWGNPSRGDDALGPLFCDRLALQLQAAGRGARCEVFQDFQLQIEHALDLAGRDLVLFVDAATACGDVPPAFSFSAVLPRRDASHSTHALSPEAVLEVFAQVHGHAPPPAFLLAISGVSFELGDGLSVAARGNLDAALAFAERLFASADAAAWSALCHDAAGPISS